MPFLRALVMLLGLQLALSSVFQKRSLQGKCCTACYENIVKSHLYTSRMFRSNLLNAASFGAPEPFLKNMMQFYPKDYTVYMLQ